MSFRVPAHVHHRAVHDEVVIMDARADAYVGLNSSAAVIWNVLSSGGSVDAAVDAVLTRFEVTPEAARTDVADLVADLVARGVLEQGAG